MVGQPPRGRPAMICGQTELVKSVPHCHLLESIAAKPRLIWCQSGADWPPSRPTWLVFGPLVVTLVSINFPFRSLEKFQIAFQVPEIKYTKIVELG
jgi:hypothetical protein